MNAIRVLMGVIALVLAAGCTNGATEPEGPGSQPRYNVSEVAPADSVETTPTAAAGGGSMGTGH